MTHYICTGDCKGVSDTPGLCQAAVCTKAGEPLKPCECTDEGHGREKKDEKEESAS